MATKKFLLRLFLAAGLTVLAVALGPSAYSQPSQTQQSDEDRNSTAPRQTDPADRTQRQQQVEGQIPASGEETTQEAKTFNGIIVKENGEFVLKDPVTKVSYKLDDAAKAKQYQGKKVKVTGKLDMNSNTILVKSIEVPM
jgi:hypothetical protein